MSARGAPAGWSGRGELATSLVLIFPLLLAYDLGVLFSSQVNGVDVVTLGIYRLVGGDRGAYLLLHALVAVGFLVWLARSRRQQTLSMDVVAPLVIESAIYALSLGFVVGLLVDDVLGLNLSLGIGRGIETMVLALGAGVHEELVFRLGLFAGGAALLHRVGVPRRLALTIALVASSLLFAAAHHYGPYGEPWREAAFAFRVGSALIFAAIFWFRSLAHAVYAHALYDVWVLVLRP